MFCPECGSFTDDNARFCANCGAEFLHVEVPVPIDITAKVKSIISSAGFLILCILFTLSIAVGCLYNVFTADSAVNEFIYEFNAEAWRDGITLPEVDSSVSVASVIISNIPSILVVIGLWLMYTEARGQENRLTGIGLIKGVTVFYLVAVSIIAGIILLLGLIIIVPVMTAEPMAAGIIIAVLVLFAGIMALMIVFYAKTLCLLNTVRNTIVTGQPSDRISVFVAVMCFIIGAPMCMSVFSVITDPLSSLVSILMGASQVMFGMFILKYRTMMRDLLYNPVPVNGAAYIPTVNNNNNINI